MPTISERDLSVFISLLSIKIREMTARLNVAAATMDEPNDQQVEEQMALQEMLDQYIQIRDTMREEYEEGFKQGINLPSHQMLISPPGA